MMYNREQMQDALRLRHRRMSGNEIFDNSIVIRAMEYYITQNRRFMRGWIEGAIKKGKTWLIPANFEKPWIRDSGNMRLKGRILSD